MAGSPSPQSTLLDVDVELEQDEQDADEVWSRITLDEEPQKKRRRRLPAVLREFFKHSKVHVPAQSADADLEAPAPAQAPEAATFDWLDSASMPQGMASEGPLAIFTQ